MIKSMGCFEKFKKFSIWLTLRFCNLDKGKNVFTGRTFVELFTMFFKSIINLTYCTIFKMTASRVDKFSAGRTKCRSPMKIRTRLNSPALFLVVNLSIGFNPCLELDLIDPRSSFENILKSMQTKPFDVKKHHLWWTMWYLYSNTVMRQLLHLLRYLFYLIMFNSIFTSIKSQNSKA